MRLRFKRPLSSRSDWQNWQPIPGVDEVLVETRRLSRFGKLEIKEALELVGAIKKQGLKVVLAWDLLPSDSDIADAIECLDAFRAARADGVLVKDAGAAMAVIAKFPRWPLQLNLETGNHNFSGLKGWCERLGPQLSRIVVSNEIPLEQVHSWPPVPGIELEVQVLGPILMFYSPRKLVTPRIAQPTREWTEAYWVGIDRPRHFPVMETPHGTFLFYEKSLCLIQDTDRIEAAGVDVGRLDLREPNLDAKTQAIVAYLNDPSPLALKQLKSLYGKTTRGFFKSNRTDRQFKRLKRGRQHAEGMVKIGEVLETAKKRYMVVRLDEPLRLGDIIHVRNPEGQVREDRVHWLADLQQSRRVTIAEPGLWLMNHIRAASATSVIFRQRVTRKPEGGPPV